MYKRCTGFNYHVFSIREKRVKVATAETLVESLVHLASYIEKSLRLTKPPFAKVVVELRHFVQVWLKCPFLPISPIDIY